MFVLLFFDEIDSPLAKGVVVDLPERIAFEGRGNGHEKREEAQKGFKG